MLKDMKDLRHLTVTFDGVKAAPSGATFTMQMSDGTEQVLKADGGDDLWQIEGMASTNVVDRTGEVVDPQSFVENLPSFEKFPVLLVNHQGRELPIGKITKMEIRDGGLWVQATISKTSLGTEVWTLIQDGVLKAFSIGFRGIRYEDGADDQPLIWREIELIEISVVNVPANMDATFSVTTKSHNDKPRRASMTEEEIAKMVGAQVMEIAPGIVTTATDTVVKDMKAGLESIEAITKRLGEIDAAIKSAVTPAQLQEVKDKTIADFTAAHAELKRLAEGAKTAIPNRALAPLTDWNKDVPLGSHEKAMGEEINAPVQHVRSIANLPEHVLQKEDARFDLLKRFQEANDRLYFLDILAATQLRSNYRGMKSLEYWGVYSRLQQEFRKAMDTATASEGTEWIPTAFSASMVELIERKATVAPLFRSFTMPTKTFEWPYQSSRATAYLIGESTADAATGITTSTPGTAKTTFTAQKIAVRALTSTEFVEDSVIAVIPFMQEDIATAAANGFDNAIINGDTAATHFDTGYTVAADDVRRLCIGIRAYNDDNSLESDQGSASTTLAAMRAIRKTMGVYGLNPADVAFIMSVSEYYDLMAVTAVTTLNTFGTQATLVQGQIERVDGCQVVVSQHIGEDLNATGLYDGVTETKTVDLVVNKMGWIIGDRRVYQVEMEKILSTDQFQLVATARKDFQPMHGTDAVSYTGYNVAP